MILVACHGPFTWGTTPEKAVDNSIALELIAQMALHTFFRSYRRHHGLKDHS